MNQSPTRLITHLILPYQAILRYFWYLTPSLILFLPCLNLTLTLPHNLGNLCRTDKSRWLWVGFCQSLLQPPSLSPCLINTLQSYLQFSLNLQTSFLALALFPSSSKGTKFSPFLKSQVSTQALLPITIFLPCQNCSKDSFCPEFSPILSHPPTTSLGSARMPSMIGISTFFKWTRRNTKSCSSAHVLTSKLYLPSFLYNMKPGQRQHKAPLTLCTWRLTN